MKRLLITILFALIQVAGFSQLAVTPGLTATQLAQKLAGAGVQISNATITGPTNYYSSFTSTGTNLGLASGILLTTGNGTVAVGPNAADDAGTIDFNTGDQDLENIVGVPTYDAAVLEFDFIPQNDTIQFRYVFASEEYPEYVCSSFNDLFGFFISGPGITGTQNIALIPGTTTPVAINTVNNGIPGLYADPSIPCNNTYPAYYVDNTNGTTIEYDGFTTVLTALAIITPCQSYHLKIVITDAGDPAYDSGVFLEEGSMSSTPVVYAGPDRNYCSGAVVAVGNYASPTWTYSWSPTAGVANPSSPYTTIALSNNTGIPVTSTYVVTASNGTCVLHDTINLTTFPTPTSSFTPVSQACGSDTITIQYTGNGNNVALYNWTFTGATVISGNGAGPYQLSYSTPGTYPLALVVNYPGCPATISNDTITIIPGPTADFIIPDSICAGSLVTITDNSINSTSLPYNWSFGSGTLLSGSGAGPYSLQFNSAGSTTIDLSLGSGTCTSTIAKTLVVKTNPVASISGPTSLCSDDTIQINFNGSANSAANLIWDLGNTSVLNSTNSLPIQLVANTIGKDTLSLIVDDLGCKDTAILPLSVIEQPQANFILPDSVCIGNPVNLITGNMNAVGVTYLWNISGGTPSTFTNVTSASTTFNSSGSQNVSLQINNNGCTDQYTDSVFVNPLPIVQFTASNACEGLPIQIQNQSTVSGGTIFSSQWNFGDNQSSNLFDPLTHTYLFDGPYTINLTVTSNHLCSATGNQSITIFDKPDAGFISDSACLGKLIHITDTSFVRNDIIANSSFSYNNSIISTNSSFAYLFNNVGALPIQLITTSTHGCIDTIIKNVIINSNPVISFSGGPLSGCEPLYVNFNETITNSNGNITNITYYFGDGDSANYTTPLHIYTSPGIYDVTLSATSQYGCTTDTTYSNYVNVYQNPIADFFTNPTEVEEFWPVINFNNTSLYGNQYFWNLGDSTFSNDFNVQHTYTAAGTYPIELIVTTNSGCADTTFGEVIIKPTYTIYVPNAFSPNNDDKNEVFNCQATNIKNFKMSIYSRWGNHVTTINNLVEGWDGKENGKTVQEDTYIYVITFTDVFQEDHQLTGRVSVIK